MRRALLAAAAALLAAVTLTACGGNAADSNTLRVGTEGTYSPFSYQGTDGQLTGYDVEVARAVIAAHRAGSPVRVVVDPAVRSEVSDVLAASVRLGVGEQPVTADDDSFATRLSAGVLDDGVGARVRVIGTRNPETLEQLADRPEVCMLNDEVTASGRVELRLWLKEQAVSMTLHRFGNPSTEFHALADEIRRG